MGSWLLLLSSFFIIIMPAFVHSACSDGACGLRETCSRDTDCGPNLFCSTCLAIGETKKCHRYQTTNITSIRDGLPFNKYSWLTTHNSFSIFGSLPHTEVPIATFFNQDDSVTDQLKNGVRGLMLDMYDFKGEVWLCHSFGGVCHHATAFRPAIETLREIEAFLLGNPREIVTIFIEDYVYTPNGLTNVLTASGLSKYWFPASHMPKNGQDWPTITNMVANNYRLVVFTSNRTKEATEGIAYQWKYVNENQYGDEGIIAGSCPKRGESAELNNQGRSLILENFFPTNPVEPKACQYNSIVLQDMLSVCYKAAGDRWANFLAVDFYKRSDGGGTFQALDTLNAGLICGCPQLSSCKLNNEFGVCDVSESLAMPPRPSSWASTSYYANSRNALLLFFLVFSILVIN